MMKRKIIRVYTINGVECPTENSFIVSSRDSELIRKGQTKVIRTGIFLPDYDQRTINFDIFYIRSDYIPLKAFLIDHELAIAVLFELTKEEGKMINPNAPLASVSIKNFERVAFVDMTKDNIKLKTNDVNTNEDSGKDKHT